MDDIINTIFIQLNRWRNLPNYQLERRTDIFFSLYLQDLIMFKTGSMVCPIIVPEFPIKRELVCPGYKTNKSIKIDYVAFGTNGTVYYTELKTDVNSRRVSQDDYMDTCVSIGFSRIINGLKDIFIATSSKQKYYQLFELLQTAEVISLPAGLKEAVASDNSEIISLIKCIELKREFPESKIVYIQPHQEKDTENKHFIGFEDIVEVLKGRNDEFSRAFSEYLLKWRSPAGAIE